MCLSYHEKQQIEYYKFPLYLIGIVLCRHECLCTTGTPRVLGDQKRESDPLEPELQVVVRNHMGAGD